MGTGLRECALTLDFAEKPFSDEKLGGALLAAPGGVRDASGSRKRLLQAPGRSFGKGWSLRLRSIGAGMQQLPYCIPASSLNAG